jgi:hypothetical protein
MKEYYSDIVLQKISEATALYHRLVLMVAKPGSGKTAILQHVHERTNAPLVNINLELSQRLLDLTDRQRILYLPELLAKVVSVSASDIVLLDNIEILFDPVLKQDPLRLLQKLARNRTIVATWNGHVDDKNLYYASPAHPEYKCYSLQEILLVHLLSKS